MRLIWLSKQLHLKSTQDISLIVIVIILIISLQVLIIFTDDILVILKPYLYDITVTDLPSSITLNK